MWVPTVTQVLAGRLTVDEAAQLLGTSSVRVKFRLSRWGDRLPLLLGTLEDIGNDKCSRGEAAARLGVSCREVNHLMREWHVQRVSRQRPPVERATVIKGRVRMTLAIDFIAGNVDLERAAASARISTRQMRRWVSDVLAQHANLDWLGLRRQSPAQRVLLADHVRKQLESEEHLEPKIDALVLQAVRLSAGDRGGVAGVRRVRKVR